jgi:hypothetical protein
VRLNWTEFRAALRLHPGRAVQGPARAAPRFRAGRALLQLPIAACSHERAATWRGRTPATTPPKLHHAAMEATAVAIATYSWHHVEFGGKFSRCVVPAGSHTATHLTLYYDNMELDPLHHDYLQQHPSSRMQDWWWCCFHRKISLIDCAFDLFLNLFIILGHTHLTCCTVQGPHVREMAMQNFRFSVKVKHSVQYSTKIHSWFACSVNNAPDTF